MQFKASLLAVSTGKALHEILLLYSGKQVAANQAGPQPKGARGGGALPEKNFAPLQKIGYYNT